MYKYANFNDALTKICSYIHSELLLLGNSLLYYENKDFAKNYNNNNEYFCVIIRKIFSLSIIRVCKF